MATESCPSCGAPLETKTRAALLMICAFCDSTILRQAQSLELVGKMAQLAEDGSPIQLGTVGRHAGDQFEVVGRIQLTFAQGYWNEWYLAYADGKTGWLGQGQGQYVITAQVPGLHPPRWQELMVGKVISLGAERLQVVEVTKATCVSGAGELPFKVGVGYEAPVADLAGRGRRFGTLDYSEDPPLVFLGERLEFDDLELGQLREFEGW